MMTTDQQQMPDVYFIGSFFFGIIYSSMMFCLRKSCGLRDRRDSKGHNRSPVQSWTA